MRLNSSITCDSMTAFPAPCYGEQPFYARYTWNTSATPHVPGYDVRICVPGNYSSSPWGVTRDAEHIAEELFLDVRGSYLESEDTPWWPFTMHCRATSTRAYFELGNYYNNYVPQPLETRWPSQDVMHDQYNDALGTGADNYPGVPETM